MSAKWIWKYRDFEFYNAHKYLLAREERGKKVPAFYEIPHYSKSVRFLKKFNIPKNRVILSERRNRSCVRRRCVRKCRRHETKRNGTVCFACGGTQPFYSGR